MTFAWKSSNSDQQCCEYFINGTTCLSDESSEQFYNGVARDTMVSIETMHLYDKNGRLLYFGVTAGNDINTTCQNLHLRKDLRIGFKQGSKLIIVLLLMVLIVYMCIIKTNTYYFLYVQLPLKNV